MFVNARIINSSSSDMFFLFERHALASVKCTLCRLVEQLPYRSVAGTARC